jgi:hypothetical protein
MRVLHLTLKKYPFDLIASGDKKEEYREVKDFWTIRLKDKESKYVKFKEFDRVQFRNGYATDSPVIILECGGISLTTGKQKWGAEKGEKYYVIKLGKIIRQY